MTPAVSRLRFPVTAILPCRFRDADGDEFVFIHRGQGVIETDFGLLEFEKGDYIILPRAVTYRVMPHTPDNFFLVIRSKAEFNPPAKGLLGQHALYDPAVIVTPERAPKSGRRDLEGVPAGKAI
jgi:homogentisate 1,2-dioxygenase